MIVEDYFPLSFPSLYCKRRASYGIREHRPGRSWPKKNDKRNQGIDDSAWISWMLNVPGTDLAELSLSSSRIDGLSSLQALASALGLCCALPFPLGIDFRGERTTMP